MYTEMHYTRRRIEMYGGKLIGGARPMNAKSRRELDL